MIKHRPLSIRTLTTLLAAAVASFASAGALAQAACEKPSAGIEIPDGQVATKEQMLATQEAVNAYIERMNVYLTCLDERSAELPEGEAGDRARIINDARYNAARDEMLQLAEQFNMQVRAWKVRQERPD